MTRPTTISFTYYNSIIYLYTLSCGTLEVSHFIVIIFISEVAQLITMNHVLSAGSGNATADSEPTTESAAVGIPTDELELEVCV